MTRGGQGRYRWLLRLRIWARKVRLARKLAFVLAGAAVLSGIATLTTMIGAPAEQIDRRTLIILLYLDAILTLALAVVISFRLVSLWVESRRGLAGAGLHARLVLLFGLLAATPAVLVAVFAALFLNFGVQVWFSDRVRTAIEESRAVASAYLEEHRKTIQADILAMAAELNREAPRLARNEWLFNRMLSAQAAMRSLPEAMVIDGNGNVIARSDFSFALQLDVIPSNILGEAERAGEPVTLTSSSEERVRAIVHLDRFVDAFLVVGRAIEADVLDHIDRTEAAAAQFQRVEQERDSFQITFVMIFAVVALLLLLAAIWIGLSFSNQIARPISSLMGAAERVRKGDLDVRVEAGSGLDEFRLLARAFNRMTGQLATQRQGLVEANQELDERRRFIEAVLEGVSAGVIGLDADGRIHLANRSAAELLGTSLDDSVGRPLAEVVPEMTELLASAKARPDRLHQGEIRIVRGQTPKTLHVRLAAEHDGMSVTGYVMTSDDITELLSAQRKAAWADVARRIAHEIRNPLTPIQLSAERLRRKYGGEITSDRETFATCTDTIIRHVGDIGRMVDEFSAFARMPQPTLKPEDLGKICRQAAFLERNRTPAVAIELALPDDPIPLVCDGQQVGRAVTNVLKNAAEAIETRIEKEGAGAASGVIRLSVADETAGDERTVRIVVDDNGVGLPSELLDRLTEPYVTTRPKGTGLGLAIVKKIMEEHDGTLALGEGELGGACVTMTFFRQNAVVLTSIEETTDPMLIATGLHRHG